MGRNVKQLVALCLLALIVGVLTWRLWPDGDQMRRQQRSRGLLRAVMQNHLADATRLLDEGADPDIQLQPLSFTQKAQIYYFEVSHRVKPPGWKQMDDANPHWSVLQIAAMRGNADMVSVLISKGADVGYRDKTGNTALGEVQGVRGGMPPALSSGRDYPRVVALLKAAEARKKARP